MRIVWKWKANVEDYLGQPDVVGVHYTIWTRLQFGWDLTPYGRSGWVGFREE
jgi:hypothetical protein